MNLYISSSFGEGGKKKDFAKPRFWLGLLPPFLAAFIFSSHLPKSLSLSGFHGGQRTVVF